MFFWSLGIYAVLFIAAELTRPKPLRPEPHISSAIGEEGQEAFIPHSRVETVSRDPLPSEKLASAPCEYCDSVGLFDRRGRCRECGAPRRHR